jgi:uncharacterized protein
MNLDGSFVPRHRLLLVSIARTIEKTNTYDATRFAWPVRRERAENVELVLGCVKGIVKSVFVPQRWMKATKENFPSLVATHTGLRWGFEGVEADDATQADYLGKRVPDDLAIGQNGFRYSDEQASKRPWAAVIQTHRLKSA